MTSAGGRRSLHDGREACLTAVDGCEGRLGEISNKAASKMAPNAAFLAVLKERVEVTCNRAFQGNIFSIPYYVESSLIVLVCQALASTGFKLKKFPNISSKMMSDVMVRNWLESINLETSFITTMQNALSNRATSIVAIVALLHCAELLISVIDMVDGKAAKHSTRRQSDRCVVKIPGSSGYTLFCSASSLDRLPMYIFGIDSECNCRGYFEN